MERYKTVYFAIWRCYWANYVDFDIFIQFVYHASQSAVNKFCS